MVSSLLTDALTNPTAVLNDLFKDNIDLDAFPATVFAHFSDIFNSLDAFREIPVLNVRFPPEIHKDNAVVSFRAMVQDTSPSPAMYLAKRTGGKCGGWGIADNDSTTHVQTDDENINYANLRECTVLWAVTIPGESSWVSIEIEGSQALTIPGKQSTHHPSQPHKFPIPDAPHIGVQVKVYGSSRAPETFRSTELRNFVGILTFEPLHADLELLDPPLVPTLHVLFSQPVPPTIIPRTLSYLEGSVRNDLIAWIAEQGLAGDHEAAEWVLLCIIARVQSRSPPILPLSLTLSRFLSPSLSPYPTAMTETPSLSIILSQIIPTLSTLPLSLHTLNTTCFTPESKGEDLHSGRLQLPSGSICVVTEGGVTEGGINAHGLTNLQALQKMITSQTLDYTFPYSLFSFDTEVGFLVLSEGRKSTFFQTTVNIPLQPAEANDHNRLYRPADEITLPSPEKLNLFRRLVGNAKVGTVTISDGAAEYIQNDFVSKRQTTSSTPGDDSKPKEPFSSDDLIRYMMVARLLALSLQQTEVTIDIWEKTKTLEAKRLARLP